MIHVEALTKRYGAILALDRLSLEIPSGTVFGLLGPNGAGKTTLLRVLMGLVFPDAGEVDRGGLSPARIGYLPERDFFTPHFTIRDYLVTLGSLADLRRDVLQQSVDQLLQEVGLDAMSGRRLGACSRGTLQRVGLAQALLGDPLLLLLDEPALGLDPAGQRFMREQIAALHGAGKTVLLSSHLLDEVTRICTHVAVLSKGCLVCSSALEDLLTPHTRVIISTDPLPQELSSGLTSLAPDITVTDGQVVLSGDAVSRKAEVLGLLLNMGIDIRQLSEQRSTLEEVYLEATGE
ncbi:MAG: ABC transporter ATP-binding protein [Anaerolineae bacterium]